MSNQNIGSAQELISQFISTGVKERLNKCFEDNEVYPKDELGSPLSEWGVRCVNDKFFECMNIDWDRLGRLAEDIYTVMQKYNGHTNYETWAMDLWLSNDYETYNHIRKDIVPECEEEAEYDDNVEQGIWTKKEAVKYCVADRIKDMVEEEMPEVEGVWSDFLNASLSEVDWDDVAEGFLEE